MKLEKNNMVFDDSHPLCLCVTSQTEGQTFAFVQVIDVGVDGTLEHTKRLWGHFSPDTPEQSLLRIMARAGEWPRLPA